MKFIENCSDQQLLVLYVAMVSADIGHIFREQDKEIQEEASKMLDALHEQMEARNLLED